LYSTYTTGIKNKYGNAKYIFTVNMVKKNKNIIHKDISDVETHFISEFIA
jgi:hypothetical protein